MFERFIGLAYGFTVAGVAARAFVARFNSFAKLSGADRVAFVGNGGPPFGVGPKEMVRNEDRPKTSSRMRCCIIGG
jgi:hypothetical protein